MRVAVAAALVLAFLAGSASAQIGFPPGTRFVCNGGEVVTRPRAGVPSLVNATLVAFPQLAFRLCSDDWGMHYFLRAPERDDSGVCTFFEAEVFAPPDPRGADVSSLERNDLRRIVHWYTPPAPWSTVRSDRSDPVVVGQETPVQFMMEISTGQCRTLDSSEYVLVDGVSSQTFRSIGQLLRSAMYSEAFFDAAVRGLSPEGCIDNIGSAAIRTRLAADALSDLRTASVVERHPIRMVRLVQRDTAYEALLEDRTTRSGFAVGIGVVLGKPALACINHPGTP
jgi:hypothetical protein